MCRERKRVPLRVILRLCKVYLSRESFGLMRVHLRMAYGITDGKGLTDISVFLFVFILKN